MAVEAEGVASPSRCHDRASRSETSEASKDEDGMSDMQVCRWWLGQNVMVLERTVKQRIGRVELNATKGGRRVSGALPRDASAAGTRSVLR